MSGITAGHDGRLVGKITGAKPSAVAFPIYSVCRFLGYMFSAQAKASAGSVGGE